MALDLENDEVFSAAIEGLPKVVELIATVPEDKRWLALTAAEQSYLQTAETLGYEGADAQQWASVVMSELRDLAAYSLTGFTHYSVVAERRPGSSSK